VHKVDLFSVFHRTLPLGFDIGSSSRESELAQAAPATVI
jgi:hypothetical protein